MKPKLEITGSSLAKTQPVPRRRHFDRPLLRIPTCNVICKPHSADRPCCRKVAEKDPRKQRPYINNALPPGVAFGLSMDVSPSSPLYASSSLLIPFPGVPSKAICLLYLSHGEIP